MIERSVELISAADTQRLAACLAASVTSGVVYLVGNLGAGKTTLARFWLESLGVTSRIKSPTYTLGEPYTLADSQHFCHFDLYRLSDPEELEFLGFRDYLAGEAILFIEWPSRGAGWLPKPDVTVTLTARGEGREITLTAGTKKGVGILECFEGASS